jgi:hypothetical protein
MFAESVVANQKKYRKNETPMWFLRAKTAPAFRFFVGLTIITFVSFTIVPRSLLAQEIATSTEEVAGDQLSPISNDTDGTATATEETATTTEEIINNRSSIINATSTTESEEAATTTDEIINDQLSIINDSATATSTEEISNFQFPISNEFPIANDQTNATSTDDQNDQLSIINDTNNQLSIINDGAAATSTAPAGESAESLIEVEFTNVYYGQVGEGRAVIAPQITSAVIRNVGDVPAAVMLWQDDMGLGRGQDGKWNIQYGARAAGGEWIFYDPYEMVLLPDVLPAGESAAMEFSVRVFGFPEIASGQTDYTGIMTINGVAAPQGEQSLPFLNDLLSNDSDFKAKADEATVPGEQI